LLCQLRQEYYAVLTPRQQWAVIILQLRLLLLEFVRRNMLEIHREACRDDHPLIALTAIAVLRDRRQDIPPESDIEVFLTDFQMMPAFPSDIPFAHAFVIDLWDAGSFAAKQEMHGFADEIARRLLMFDDPLARHLASQLMARITDAGVPPSLLSNPQNRNAQINSLLEMLNYKKNPPWFQELVDTEKTLHDLCIMNERSGHAVAVADILAHPRT